MHSTALGPSWTCGKVELLRVGSFGRGSHASGLVERVCGDEVVCMVLDMCLFMSWGGATLHSMCARTIRFRRT